MLYAFTPPPALVATICLSLFACGSSPSVKTVTTLVSGNPGELGKVLVDEEEKIVDVCSDLDEGGTQNEPSSKITALLKAERTRNLGAILAALRGPTSPPAPNACLADDPKRCAEQIRDAYNAALASGTGRAEVAKGLDSALGKLSELNEDGLRNFSARIRFSMLAVDGYIRLAQALEHEVDEFVRGLDIPVPVVSSIAHAVVRDVAAEVIASGTDKVVDLLERHSLVHRPSMVRQACERYLTERSVGIVATRGLQRIILSPSKNPTVFVDRRCALIKIAATRGDATNSYDACGVIATAANANAPAASLLTADDGLKAASSVSATTMPRALPMPSTVASSVGQDAIVVQTAALACNRLATGESGTPVPCSLGTFNALGSAATMAPPKVDQNSGLPDGAEVRDLVHRIEELIAAQSRTALSVEKLRIDLDSIGASVDSRLDSLSRAVELMSRAQRDATATVEACRKGLDAAKDARKRVFEALGAGSPFSDVCKGTDRWVSRELTVASKPLGRIVVSVAELCNEQRPVPTAIALADGLFATGQSKLTDTSKTRLGQVWSQIVAASSAQQQPVFVTGHVDPLAFGGGESGKLQQLLMANRAAAAVAHLRTLDATTEFKEEVGQVPAAAACGGAGARHCAMWRTISIESAGLFPTFKCK